LTHLPKGRLGLRHHVECLKVADMVTEASW
jgi:hypothetical protein